MIFFVKNICNNIYNCLSSNILLALFWAGGKQNIFCKLVRRLPRSNSVWFLCVVKNMLNEHFIFQSSLSEMYPSMRNKSCKNKFRLCMQNTLVRWRRKIWSNLSQITFHLIMNSLKIASFYWLIHNTYDTCRQRVLGYTSWKCDPQNVWPSENFTHRKFDP